VADERPIRTRRVEAGLTQAELAAAVGAHKRTIGRIERGQQQPGRNLRDRIERVLAEHSYRRVAG
jgi:DNA-binding XRE family transcriptional regulator